MTMNVQQIHDIGSDKWKVSTALSVAVWPGFSGFIAQIPGCGIAASGDTVRDAIENLKEHIVCLLEISLSDQLGKHLKRDVQFLRTCIDQTREGT